MSNNIEPLAAPLWFQRVAVIASGDLKNTENSLRHAGHLIQLAPTAFRKVLPPLLDEAKFEALLEAGDLDRAARQLFGPATTLLIEAGGDHKPVRAVIGCPILRRTIDSTGESAAVAMLNAWTRWLMMLRVEFGSELDSHQAPDDDWRERGSKSVCPGAN